MPEKYDHMNDIRTNIKKKIFQETQKNTQIYRVNTLKKSSHSLEIRVFPLSFIKEKKYLFVQVKLIGENEYFHITSLKIHFKNSIDTILEAFNEAWDTIEKMRLLEKQPFYKLVQSLSDNDIRIQNFVIELLGKRKIKQSCTPLVNLFKKQDALKMKIVGSLIKIGDSCAVLPLIESTYQKEDIFVIQIIFALAHFETKQVEGFLVTLASGHSSENIRNAAKKALKEVINR